MKRLALAAALACALTPPAVAFDADPAHFRADPQAWVRNTLMPTCKTPAADMVAACDCMVPLIAERISEADVASVNNIDKQKGLLANPIAKIAMGATMICMPRK